MRLYEVGDRLYISGSPAVSDLPKLHDANIQTIVCCSKKRTSLGVLRGLGAGSAYRPLVDGKVVNAAAVEDVVDLVQNFLIRRPEAVLVHCLAGRNRSATVAALVEARRRGWTGAEALQHIRVARPNAIHNPAYERFLLDHR